MDYENGWDHYHAWKSHGLVVDQGHQGEGGWLGGARIPTFAV